MAQFEDATVNEKIIMFDSPEAAQFRTDIKGWVSRGGRFFGDGPSAEADARYHSCTHRPCRECGAPTIKRYIKCDACRELADIARYQAMPRAEWDGKAMLYSETTDRFYSDLGEAEDHLDEMEERCTFADLRLVICEPNYVRKLDPDDFADDLPEEGDLPDGVRKAIDEFNRAVDGIVLSWSPGKTALFLQEPVNV